MTALHRLRSGDRDVRPDLSNSDSQFLQRTKRAQSANRSSSSSMIVRRLMRLVVILVEAAISLSDSARRRNKKISVTHQHIFSHSLLRAYFCIALLRTSSLWPLRLTLLKQVRHCIFPRSTLLWAVRLIVYASVRTGKRSSIFLVDELPG